MNDAVEVASLEKALIVEIVEIREVSFEEEPSRWLYHRIKRVLDVLVAGWLLFALLPAFAVIALLIKLGSPGPIIFWQKRFGKWGKPFTIYKFRTMYVGAEEQRKALKLRSDMRGGGFKMKRDPRVTPLGLVLRYSSLDELPQLWNVLRGEMSLVGPRPHPLDELDLGKPLHCKKLKVLPGLTCLWQISGRNLLTFQEWLTLDAYYVDHQSLWLDFYILGRTLPAVISGKGAY